MTGGNEPDLAEALADSAREHVPLGRWARPEEAADAVLFLAGDHSTYLTGTEIAVDGGLAQI